jgi:cephalosporin hydroxylase
MRPYPSTSQQRGTKAVTDWTIREWLEYHQANVHQGSLQASHGFQQSWMGRTIWKNPLDCWVYQEILYDTKPEMVIELGVAHGGGTLYLANLLDLLGNSSAQVIGIELDLSRVTDLRHPRIQLIGGNCLDPGTVRQVTALCKGRKTMLIADCDHNKDHVMQELRTYSPLVSVGCYYVVEDGICDVMGWPPVPGPQAACVEYLRENPHFINDMQLREKYLITYNFSGYLKRIG